MEETSVQSVTGLLLAWRGGDEGARDALLPLVYQELHRLAGHRLGRERAGHTLQPTALVHEAYLRLVDQNRVEWRNRAHFFAIAAEMMRRVLVDYARKRRTGKRGGDAVQLSLDEQPMDAAASSPAAEVIALDDALETFARIDPRKSRLVELRFFGGLSIEEAAAVLGVSPGTAMRDWTLAKAWLRREMAK